MTNSAQNNTTLPPRRTTIFNTDTNIRYPPRIPRLIRRPLVHRDIDGNVVGRPGSISSAISITREHTSRRVIPPVADTIGADAYYRIDDSLSSIYDLHCVTDEKVVDLAELCDIDVQSSQSNTNYVPLDFEVIFEDGGRYSSIYSVENILRNDGSVYCSEKCGTINIMFKYNGNGKSCSLTHIVIKSPTHGYTSPCKEGMIFISHKPIDVQRTQMFDTFTKQDFEQHLQINQDASEDADPVAWFDATEQRQTVVPLDQRSTQFVLVKLLRSDFESENMDIQYIGFVGYAGSRCFAQGRIV